MEGQSRAGECELEWGGQKKVEEGKGEEEDGERATESPQPQGPACPSDRSPMGERTQDFINPTIVLILQNLTGMHSDSQWHSGGGSVPGGCLLFSRLPESPVCLGSLWRQGCMLPESQAEGRGR